MLVTSIFSFSGYNVLHTLQKEILHLVCRLQMLSICTSQNLSFGKDLTFHKQSLVFTCLQYMPFENTVRKGEIAFSLIGFYPFEELFPHFRQIWNCRLQTLSVWKSLKFVVWERIKIYRPNMLLSKIWDSPFQRPEFWRHEEGGFWKGAKDFLLFSHSFSIRSKTDLLISVTGKLSFGDVLKLHKAKGFLVWQRVKPFPNKTWFLRVCITNLFKTL